MRNTPKYQPVRVPFSQYLKEFRLRVFPVIVFFVVLMFALYLWDFRVYNPSFTGRVYADATFISSPTTGLIQNMHVREFDRVQKGDTLAIVVVSDSLQYASQIELIRAQIEYVKTSMDPISSWQRNRINLAELKADHASEQLKLSSMYLRREIEESRVNRLQDLFDRSLESRELLDDARLVLNLINSEIAHTEELVRSLDQQITTLDRELGQDEALVLSAALRVHEAELKAIEEEIKPAVIVAPFDGSIGKMFYQNGSIVPDGEPFMIIESEFPTHIIGYMRQPLTVRPEVGMEVQVRTRTAEKRIIPAFITSVGAQITIIDETVQRPGSSMLETGLPVKVEIFDMESLPLLPGEFVDIIVNQRGQ